MLLPFVQYSDTSNMLSPYRRTTTKITNSDLANSAISGVSLGSNLGSLTAGNGLSGTTYNGGTGYTWQVDTTIISTKNNVTVALVAKLNISDTAAMLANRLKISDTASMLSPYARTSNLPSLAPYLLKSDSLSGGYTTWLLTKKKIDSLGALKVNYTDTSAMLANLLRKTDTATMLAPFIQYSDTASMLNPYYRTATATAALALKLNISDTAAMLSNRLKISDTSSMLSVYTRVQRFEDSLATVQSRIQTKQPLGNYLTFADSTTILAGRWLPNRTADSILAMRTLANTKQNILTNPVTGTGTTNTIPKFTGTSTIGNSNIVDNGTTVTSNIDFLSLGKIAIGATGGTTNLRIGGTITGGTSISVVNQNGVVQSGVTNTVFGYNNTLSTQAAPFSLSNYVHYTASQGTIGSGSVVALQTGFNVPSTLTGATENIAFRGSLAQATGRWNLFMDGTANNYLNGSTLFGTTTANGIDRVIVNGSSLVGNIRTSTNTISSTNTNGNIILDANGTGVIQVSDAILVSSSVTAQRLRATSLVVNKDSIPITTSDLWALQVDTSGTPYTNRITRRNISDVHTGSIAFDTSSRTLTINQISGGTTSVVIPRGTASGTSGITALSSSRTGNLVTVSGDNGSSTIFSVRDADSSSPMESLTASFGISGSPYNGTAPLTWLVDTSTISTKANVTGTLVGYTTTAQNALKLNISDTSAMLANLLKISDTANMLSNRLRISDTTSMLANRFKISDTASMLLPFVQYSDTAAIVAGYVLNNRFLDSLTNVQTRIQTKQPLGAYITLADSSTILAGRWLPNRSADSIAVIRALANTKLNISDTASMLSNRLKISDTLTMLSNRLKISDTSNMLSPYARTANLPSLTPYLLKADSLSGGYTTWLLTKKKIDSIGALKVNYTDTAAIVANRLKISDTATMLLPFVQYSDTANIVAGYVRSLRFSDSLTNVQTRIQTKLAIADTAAMLAGYTRLTRFADSLTAVQSRIQTKQPLGAYITLADSSTILAGRWLPNRSADSIAVIRALANTKLNISDTTAMLANRLKISDTLTMLSRYLRKSDTATMLTPFVQYSDTANQMSGL